MNRKDTLFKILKILSKADTNLTDLEISYKLYPNKKVTPVMSMTTEELLLELEKKRYVNKSSRVTQRTQTQTAIIDIVDNRYSITIDGINYLSSRGLSHSINVWFNNNQLTLKVVLAILAAIFSGITIYFKFFANS